MCTQFRYGIRRDEVDDPCRAFRRTKPQRMGTGLAISRSIVEARGGHISATPNNDRGTAFTVTLPIADEDQKNDI